MASDERIHRNGGRSAAGIANDAKAATLLPKDVSFRQRLSEIRRDGERHHGGLLHFFICVAILICCIVGLKVVGEIIIRACIDVWMPKGFGLGP
ncbi:MAG TPA: hypothetical protein VMS17_22685 [Gemmataceae bacterium]|nr:hypothetical protein [Gemmataceae bacterium]